MRVVPVPYALEYHGTWSARRAGARAGAVAAHARRAGRSVPTTRPARHLTRDELRTARTTVRAARRRADRRRSVRRLPAAVRPAPLDVGNPLACTERTGVQSRRAVEDHRAAAGEAWLDCGRRPAGPGRRRRSARLEFVCDTYLVGVDARPGRRCRPAGTRRPRARRHPDESGGEFRTTGRNVAWHTLRHAARRRGRLVRRACRCRRSQPKRNSCWNC